MLWRPFMTFRDVSSSGTSTCSRTQAITSAGGIGVGSVVRKASRICEKYFVKRLLLTSIFKRSPRKKEMILTPGLSKATAQSGCQLGYDQSSIAFPTNLYVCSPPQEDSRSLWIRSGEHETGAVYHRQLLIG